jgi:hypothetical protein
VIFSLLTKVSTQQFQVIPANTRWQMYEIAGLAKAATPVLTKVANQPTEYNNVSPIYGSDDRIFFSSDRPITGNPIHYPQIEEYESGPTSLGPVEARSRRPGRSRSSTTRLGPVHLPFLDSFGQVIFTRWDHLQQDQQALNAVEKALNPAADDFFRAYTYLNENDVGEASASSSRTSCAARPRSTRRATTCRHGARARLRCPSTTEATRCLWASANLDKVGQAAGIVSGRANQPLHAAEQVRPVRQPALHLFVPWQINQDGTGHETFRHMGRQDVGMYANQSYFDDGRSHIPPCPCRPAHGRPRRLLPAHRDALGLPQALPQGPRKLPRNRVARIQQPRLGIHPPDDRYAQAVSENGKAVQFVKLTDPDPQTRPATATRWMLSRRGRLISRW